MIGKNSERPSLTGQTVGMIEYRYEKVRNPYQTVRMIGESWGMVRIDGEKGGNDREKF